MTRAFLVQCFGCPRTFNSYASMILHLETESCVTDIQELGCLAVNCPQSHHYITQGSQPYLRTLYGTNRWDCTCDELTPFQCNMCQAVFYTHNQANIYATSPVHDRMVFRCPGCSFRFNALSALLQHVEAGACSEEIFTGTGALGRLLRNSEERLRGRDEVRHLVQDVDADRV